MRDTWIIQQKYNILKDHDMQACGHNHNDALHIALHLA